MSFAGKLAVLTLLCALLLVAAYALSRRFLGAPKTHQVFGTGALLLVSTVLTLLAAEWVVRIAYADITTTGDNTSYFARRWRERNPPTENELGYREREFSAQPAAGVYRIAVVGDSFAYGQGILAEQRFSNLLEMRLRAGGGSFEVLNFARPGTETIEHVEILREDVLPARPDFVLLQWFVNDAENGRYWGRPIRWRLIPSDRISSWLHTRSALYYLANTFWQQLQPRLGIGSTTSYTDYMVERFSDPESESAVIADTALREFIEACRHADVPVGIVLFPQLTGAISEHYPLAFLHERVLDTCEEYGIPCVDLRGHFASYASPTDLWANRLDSHPGTLANRIASDAILETFRSVWP